MEGLEVIRIKGIPLRIHSSWAVILLLFTWSAQNQITNLADAQIPLWTSWLIGFVTALLLFMSVLLHELGHSFMAIHEGVKVKSITLFFLGGIAKVDRECKDPMSTLRVAIAGPIVSFILSIIFLISIPLFSVKSIIFSNLLTQIGALNLLLGLFNLLPGLPLDGGIIIKSLVWHFTGSKKIGIKVATKSGRFLSLSAIFLGSFISISVGSLAGLWLIVFGWIGFSASRSQSQILLFQETLCEIKVFQAKNRRYRVLDANLSLKHINSVSLDSGNSQFNSELILVSKSGRWIGYINNDPLKEVPVQDWENYCLEEYVLPLSNLPFISEKESLWKAVLEVEKNKGERLLVMNLAGLPIGTLDRIDIGLAVLKRIGIKVPSNFLDLAKKQNAYPLGLSLPEVVEGMLVSGLIEKDNIKGPK